MDVPESPSVDGSFGVAQSDQGSSTFKAEESLKNWRDEGSDVGQESSVVSGSQNDTEVSDKKEDVLTSEKKSSKVEDTMEKDSKESDSESDAEEGEDTNSDEGVDEDKESDSEVDGEDNETNTQPDNTEPYRPNSALEDRLEKLESMLQQSQDRLNEKQYAESIQKDVELTKNPFEFEMDIDSIRDSLSEDALDYFNDDPEAAQYQSELISKAMNKFMSDFKGYSEAQNRVGEYQQIQAREKQAQVSKELSDRGLDVGVFKTKEFATFEQDPRNSKMLDGFYDRFKGNDVEYAHHVYDAYQSHLKSLKKSQAKEANEKASNARKNIGSKQKQADSTKPKGSGKQPSQPDKTFNVSESLSAFRKSQG